MTPRKGNNLATFLRLGAPKRELYRGTMSQSRISTFFFAVASLTGILCVSATQAQIDGFPPSTPQHRSFPIPSSDTQPI